MSTWLGVDLWKQCQISFAYLMTQGFCSSGRCTTFPILVGETGSAYKTDSDKQWLQDFSDFVYARVSARGQMFSCAPGPLLGQVSSHTLQMCLATGVLVLCLSTLPSVASLRFPVLARFCLHRYPNRGPQNHRNEKLQHAYTDHLLPAPLSCVLAQGNAAQYAKQPLSGWLWWAYNENSGDTGGIVMNNWQDLDWNKLGFQMDKLGLQPWYKWPSAADVIRRRRPRHTAAEAAGANAAATADVGAMDSVGAEAAGAEATAADAGNN